MKSALDGAVEVSAGRSFRWAMLTGMLTALVPWRTQRLPAVCMIHAPLPVQPDKVDAFIAAVTLDGLGSTSQEPGCLRFDVYQNINKPSELYLYEVYVNKTAFEYHTKTPHIATWRETVKDWYAGERTGGRRGRNIWPPDNWGWSSGKPAW